jgi:hypothetical protein
MFRYICKCHCSCFWHCKAWFMSLAFGYWHLHLSEIYTQICGHSSLNFVYELSCIWTPLWMRERDICPINKFQFRDVSPTASISIHVTKWSLYRPRQALRVPGAWGSQTSRQLAHESSKFVSLIPQEIFLVLISFGVWVDPRAIMWPGGLC